MAKIVIPNEGKPDLLAFLLGQTANTFADWLLMLWQNSSLSPGPATVYANLTECTFPGYSRVTLTKNLWSVPGIVSDQAVSSWTGATPTWTNTGAAQPCYGYAFITPTASKIVMIQQWDSPVPMGTGGILAFTPQVILDSLM